MIEFLGENIDYHISNMILLLIFVSIYTTIKLRIFRANSYFFKEFIKNLFAGLFIYGVYMLFLVSKTIQ